MGESAADEEALGARVADPRGLRTGDGRPDLAAVRALHYPDRRRLRGPLPDAVGHVVGAQGARRPAPESLFLQLGPLAARNADGLRDLRSARLPDRDSALGTAAAARDLQRD